ncbi:MAG: hypothetical protein MUF21_05595 [Gemmatimonadaceae bacterium]|nr:hypothetical protein [Gemmatimonadaceae bacterium]
MMPDNAGYMHIAYALVGAGIVGYLVSLVVRSRALARRGESLRGESLRQGGRGA